MRKPCSSPKPLLFFDLQLLALVLQLLHSQFVFDFFPIELDLSHLVVDDGSQGQHLQVNIASQRRQRDKDE